MASCLLFISLAAPLSGFAQVQTLGGQEVEGALKIECGETGMRVYAYLDGQWKQQTFSDHKSSMVHYEQGGSFKYTAGYYSGSAMTCTKNENTSSTVNERIWTGGSVQLTMRTTYVSPSKTESYEFEIKNTSGSALNNVKFFHGQDTYLGYSDAGGGYWNYSAGTVGVKKPAQDDPNRLIYQELGSTSTRPDDYASTSYGTVASLVAQGALNQTLNTNYYTDNGYAVQWNRGTLGPGETWTIAAGETMAVGASLTATLPSGEIGTSTIVTGVLENAGDTTASGTMSVDVDLAGWTATINGSTSFSLSQGQSQNVPITITCPAVSSVGQVATVTLTATSPDETADAPGSFTAVYYDGVALVSNVTDDGAASIAENSDFGGRPLGAVVTNMYTLYNGGPSNITLLTNALTGSSRFAVQGLPSSLAVGASTDFTVTFDVASYEVETATLTLSDHKAWSPFVMNLSGFGFTISTNNGPSGYIRTLTVTAGKLGNGEDITQVTIGGKNATIESQTTNSVTFAAPGLYPGWQDIVISSVSEGTQTIVDGYLVNGRGRIYSVSPNVAETGGVDITIDGVNLSNGDVSDLTAVTICGIPATDWRVNGTTQVVVKTGAGGSGRGHVYVTSTSRGIASLYNGFIYGGAQISMTTTNGAVIADDQEASAQYGTDFGYVATGRSAERTFAITNSGPAVLNISMVATNGEGAEYFDVVSCPTQVSSYGSGQLKLAFSSDVPVQAHASLLLYNNSSNSPYRLNVMGDAITVSPMSGPYSGGMTVTLSNMSLEALGHVTEVEFINRSGTVTAQGANWMQFVTPEMHYTQTGWLDGVVMSGAASRPLINSYHFNSRGSIDTISPSSCNWDGGVQVVIRGENLCTGPDDVISVYLSGVKAASVVSASPTQVVVMAGAGFGDTRISYVNSTQYGTAYGYNNFRYTGLDNSPHSFSTNAGTASGGQELTFTFADMGSPVVVTQVVVNKSYAQVIETGSNSVTFLTPPADWVWRGITNMTLYSEDHGFGSYRCHYGTNLGYRYRGHAFIGRPDIQNGVWQGGWTNLGFGIDSGDEVVSLAFGPEGKLYAAGELDVGYYDSKVAYFENGIWQETGIKATEMQCMIRHGDHLYVGGLYLTNRFGQSGPRGPILRGSGRDWTSLSYTSETVNAYPWCYALHHDGTYLYASDYHYSDPDEADVFRYNGSSWTALPDTSFTGKVYALGTYNGRLYRSGDRNTSSDPIPVQYWSGASWPDAGAIDESIYGNYPPRALAFCEFDGDYYMGQAAGNPYDDDAYKAQLLSRDGIAFSPGWEFVSGFVGMENMLREDNTGTRALCSDGEYLFAAGVQMWYTPPPPGSNYSCVAAFDGTSWSAIGTQGLTTNYGEWGNNASHINSMIKTPRGIYAGGWFSRIGTDTNFMTGATNIAFFLFNQTNGLSVQSASYAGGTTLTIHGGNLGNGTADDVYRVTLCGVDATINSVSSTQIVVTTQQGIPGLGDAAVYTYDYGTIVQSNVFTYTGGAGLRLYNSDDIEIANERAASYALGTRSLAVEGNHLTNTFRVVNTGTSALNITGVQTNGTGAHAFACTWPSSVAAGQTGSVTVVFQPSASGTFTAAVDVVNSSLGLNSPYTLYLECTAATLSTNNGPYAGGNSLTISNANFGTITNVLIGGRSVAFTESPAGVLNLTLPALNAAGPVDIVLQTSDNGDFTLPDAYTYNPAGWINREQEKAFIIGEGDSYSSTGHGPLGIAYKSRHHQYLYTSNDLATAGLEGPATITAVGYNVYQAPSYPLKSFLVRMKSTTETNLSAGWISSGLQTCYSNASYAPVAGGFDPMEFSTGFEWDGQQNLLLDTAFASVYTTHSSGRTKQDYNANSFRERYVYAYSDQTDVFTGGTVWHYVSQLYIRAIIGKQGVIPAIGLSTGGYEVVISGRDLSSGDVTNVTLCGVAASEIISANATQVVVRAGAAPGEMLGAVSVYSTSHGVTTLPDAFRYAGTYSVLGTDGLLIEGGSAPSEDNGTLFANAGGNASITNVLSITNNLGSAVTISSLSFTGAQATSFSVLPTSLTLDAHAVSNIAVVYSPQEGGDLEAQLFIESDSGNASVNMGGTAWTLSTSVGAEEGGISVTITNGSQMGFGDITEVIVGGTSVSPTAQGENWVTITMPGHSAGMVDVVVISDVLGETTLANAFTYIPAPVIYGSAFTWTPLPGLPTGLEHADAFVLNDQLYAVGGYTGSYSTNLYRFDGYRWHADEPGLPEGRYGGAGTVFNGKYYYCGGVGTLGARTNVYCFDGTSWTQAAGLPEARRYAVAGVVDGHLVVAGGDSGSGAETNTWLFDGTDWAETAGLPSARTMQGGAVRNGKLYVYGGQTSAGTASFNQYSFDGSAWATEPGLPVLNYDMAAAPLNARNYAFGGTSGSATNSSVYRYNGIGWESVTNMAVAAQSQAATFWRGALYVIGGLSDDRVVLTNSYRLTDGGVSPISGYPAGGYEVTICGTNLCDGTTNDVEWVTLCGATAEVVSVSATQIVVTAGNGQTGTGNVEIRSATFGPVVASNAFTYLRGAITLIGTNGADIAEGDPAGTDNGTDFGSMMVSQSRTNIFGIRNTGNAPLTLSAIDGAGQGGPSFTVTEFPSTELLPGATGQITVVCASQGGEQLGQLAFRDNVNVVPFTPEMGGHTASVFHVKSYGTGSGLGLSETELNYNTPYGTDPAAQTFVVSNVGGDPLTFSNAVTYAGFGENWLTIGPVGAALNPAASQTVTASVSVAGVNAGTHAATVSVWCATATNSPQRIAVTLVVAPIAQTLTWTNPGTQTYTNETLLDATVDSGLSPAYTLISGPGALTNLSYQTYVDYNSTGTIVVVASQPGNVNYEAAVSVTQSWNVIGAAGVITLTNLTQEYTGSAIEADVTTSPSGIAYEVTYDGLTSGPTNVGTYEVVATITEPLISGSTTGTLEITTASQQITFPPLDGWHTNSVVGLSAIGGASGNPVTFAIQSGPGSLDGTGTNLSFSGMGAVYVVASQAGGGNYDPAPPVTNEVVAFTSTPYRGPYAGGNEVAFLPIPTSKVNISNVLVSASDQPAELLTNGVGWCRIRMPAATNAGLTDITLQDPSGDYVLHEAYIYNPEGRIEQAGYEEYRVSFASTAASAYPSYTSPDGTYTWTEVARDDDWKELKTTNGAAAGVYLKPFGFGSGATPGWGTSGYDWIARDGANKFIYLNSSTVHTNYVVITNLQGSSYRVDVVNAYDSTNYPNSDTLHEGIYQPGTPADNANYGNWPSGGNTNAGRNINLQAVFTSQSNYVTWADAAPSNGALSVVLFKTQQYGNMLNCLRISGYSGPMPVTPSSGTWAGGYPVAIAGSNLGSGTDITNVTLCGVQATINSQTATRVWVTAAQATTPGVGDVIVQSTSFGTTTGSNLFTYTGAGIELDAPAFAPALLGTAVTNIFTVTNSGTEALLITGVTNIGTGGEYFDLSAMPTTVDAGTASNFPVVFNAAVLGSYNPTCRIENNSPAATNMFALYGSVYQLNTNNGPSVGGNILTITNGLLGNGSDITNVTVGGYVATIGAQGENWVQITLGAGATGGGTGDIVIQSETEGETTLPNAYTYNPAGVIADSSTTNAYIIGIGSLTNVTGATGYSPIAFYYYSSHYQFLYQSNDFVNAGMTGPARIVGLGFDVVSSTDGKALPSFLVRMKHSANDDMAGGMEGDDLTVCYSNSGYIATAGGFDMLMFDTPFEWDGSSNVIVDTAFAKASTWCNCGQTTYDAIDSRGSVYKTDTFDTRYDFTHGATISVLPRIRILTESSSQAVVPSSGSWTGGIEVALSGSNLGNGSDITNVTLCGVQATINSQTATRVWVTTAQAAVPGVGDVVVQSTSYGTTTGSNLFTYTGSGIAVSCPALGPTRVGVAVTNVYTVVNHGTETLIINNGTIDPGSSPYINPSPLPHTLDAGTSGTYAVVYTPMAAGTHTATVHVANNSPVTNYSFVITGSCFAVSTNLGPYAGGNTITITNGHFGTITNVLLGPPSSSSALLGPHGDNWFTITLPGATNAGTVDITVQTSDNGDILLANAYTYNPAGVIAGGTQIDWSAWEPVAGIPEARDQMYAAELGGSIYAIGGRNSSWSSRTNVYRFDGTTWAEVAGLPAIRTPAGAVYDGKIHVMGSAGGSGYTNVFAFDGSSWIQVAGLPTARVGGMAGTFDGTMYFAGGQTNNQQSSTCTNVYAFDGSSWTEVRGLPKTRNGAAAGALSSGWYLAGGVDAAGGLYPARTNTYVFDGASWSESEPLISPLGLAFSGSAVLSNALYVLGGWDGAGSYSAQTNVYRFDGTNWTEIAGLPVTIQSSAGVAFDGSIYSIGGYDSTARTHMTNVYRYPAQTMGYGVMPESGSWTGGYQVTISGSNLGDGSDITNVMLAGVSVASIDSQSTTQVVVTADAHTQGVLGDVVVQSVSYGATTRTNAFTYTASGIHISVSANAPVVLGTVMTNSLSVTNSGNEALMITAATNNGVGAAMFDVSGLVGLTVDPGAVSNVPVVFTASEVGTFTPTCYLANNSPFPNYDVDLTGSCFAVSTNVGPYAGGNTITITNGHFGTITNVLLGPPSSGTAMLGAHGDNWFTVTLPGATNAGTVDFIVQTSDNGEIFLAHAYTYNPAGEIHGYSNALPASITLSTNWLDGTNGTVFAGAVGGEQSGTSVSSVGDINGDGYADIVVGAPDANPNQTGEAYLIFGGGQGYPSPVTLSSAWLDGTNGVLLRGAAWWEKTGGSVSSAGDVNGDGYADLLIGAYGASVDGKNYAGETYLLFGRSTGFPATVVLTNTWLDGTNGMILAGAATGDQSGWSVSSAGDVNGDGYADLLIGANQADPDGRSDAGAAYLVYGRNGGFPAEAMLSEVWLDGTNGMMLVGAAAGDVAGYSVSSAGDVNGDGFDDLLVGAIPLVGRTYAGAAYLVLGGSNALPAKVVLSNWLDGTNGFKLSGAESYDHAGVSVASAGDVNGDGYADFLVGAEEADPEGRNQAGAAYLVFGRPDGYPAEVLLSPAWLNGTNGIVLAGADFFGYAGGAVSSAGDVNRDGCADFLIGAALADPEGIASAGATYLVYGRTNAFPAMVTLTNTWLDGTNGVLLAGAVADDRSGMAVSSAGDVNRDGFDDLLIGASWADPDGRSKAGETYLVYGLGDREAVHLSSGSWTGGYAVVISGTNLCNGSTGDVTQVMLAGATAAVQNVYGSTQIVVVAGSGVPGTGDVVVTSIDFGTTTKSNAFIYEIEDQTITFSNPGGQNLTNVLALSASANSGLQISYHVVSGPGSLSGGSNVSFSGSGTVTVSAAQSGNIYWNPAVTVTQSFRVFTLPPVVTNFALTNGLGEGIAYTSNHFRNAYGDPEGAPLYSIRIDSLPVSGTLELSSVAVTTAQRIVSGELNSLAWVEPSSNWHGTTAFDWSASDGESFSTGSATATVVILNNHNPKIETNVPDYASSPGALDTEIPLDDYLGDPESGALTYEIVSISEMSLFDSVTIDALTGVLTIDYESNPAIGDSSVITVKATDPVGLVRIFEFRVTIGEVPTWGTTPITLNWQNGLFEQTVTVTNESTVLDAQGVRLVFTNIATGITVYNGDGEQDGYPILEYYEDLPAAGSIALTVQYYTTGPDPVANPPQFRVELIMPELVEDVVGPMVNVYRSQALANGNVLIEFRTVQGQWYCVQYSETIAPPNWQTVVPYMKAPANTMQWIDNGPPATYPHPKDIVNRYYRVIEVNP